MPGYPCCCTGCDIAADEFTRASVGGSWAQTGAWSIASNRLTTNDSDALIIHVTNHPDSSSSHHINVLGQVSDSGSQIRGVVAYDSADDYLFAELTINSSDCSEVKLFERVGGTTSQVGDTRYIAILATGTDYRMEVCYQDDTYPNDDGELCVKISLADGSHSWTFCETSITATGDQVGLGTGTLTSSGSASFDNFEWSINKVDKGSCPDCKGSTCLILADNFNRSDSTDLGCNWDETSGAWEIDDNKLVTSSSSAQATTTLTNFRPEYSIIGGTVRFGTGPFDTDALGDVARMMLDVSGSNSHALQITCGVSAPAPGFGKVELLKGTTVLATVVKIIMPGVDWNFTVCLQDDYIEADIHSISDSGVVGDQLHLDAVTTAYGGNKAALGTGSGNESVVAFDYFTWQRAKNADDLDCPTCVDEGTCSWCIGGTSPSNFKLVVSGFSSGTEECDINGTYILNRSYVGWNLSPTACHWIATASVGDSGSCYFRRLNLRIGRDATNHFIDIWHYNPNSTFPCWGSPCQSDWTYWRRDFHGLIDCLNIADMDIPFVHTNESLLPGADGTYYHYPGPWGPYWCDNDDYTECTFDNSSLKLTAI